MDKGTRSSFLREKTTGFKKKKRQKYAFIDIKPGNQTIIQIKLFGQNLLYGEIMKNIVEKIAAR